MAQILFLFATGVLILVLCDTGFSMECVDTKMQYEDFIYKSDYADGVVVGSMIREVDIPSESIKGMELKLKCTYKGGDFSQTLTVGGRGHYQDGAGWCHNNTVKANEDYIFYLRKVNDNQYRAIYMPDSADIFLNEIIIVCALDRKRPTGVPDEVFNECPEILKNECENFEGTVVTPDAKKALEVVTEPAKATTPAPTKKAETPKPMGTTQKPGKTGGQSNGDPDGAAVSFLSRVLCIICISMCFLLH